MSPLLRRRRRDRRIAPRRPHAGLLRRERRALLKAREDELRELGGLLVEMYRRGGFRDDLLAERAATVVGIDARLAEIEDAAPRAAPRRPLRVRRTGPARLALLPELRPVAPGARVRRRLRRDSDRARPEALMASEAAERRTAIAAADDDVPALRRRARRRPALLPRLRLRAAASSPGRCRRCAAAGSRRLGWYPGDWVWLSLLTLLVAAAGAAAAIVVTRPRPRPRAASSLTAATAVARGEPRRPQTGDRTRPSNTATLPTAPEPGAQAEAERTHRMAGERERLDDRPRLVPEGERPARPRSQTATAAAKAGLAQVGMHRLGRVRQPAARVFRRLHAGSTARKPTPTPPSRRPARRASAARIRARSPADRDVQGAARAG